MFSKDITSYDLSLDRSCVFLPNRDNGESLPLVTGSFRFSLAKTAYIKRIKVRLRGTLVIPRDGSLITEDRQNITFNQEQVLTSAKQLGSFHMTKGDYEFPFSIETTRGTLETITGVQHHYHSYRVDAIIERRYKKDLVTSQPLRIYTTFGWDPDDVMSTFPQIVEGRSEDNIQYSISIPNQYIPFGCIFPVECQFSAPLSDIKPIITTTVSIEVIESHNLELDATAAQSARDHIYSVTSSKKQTIFKETFSFTQESFLRSDSFNNEWHLRGLVYLPRSFESCSQTISTKMLKISHELVVRAKFQDAAGQVLGEVAGNIPFSIYMSPSVIGRDAMIRGRTIQDATDPPPSYSHHAFNVRVCESTGVVEHFGHLTPMDGSFDGALYPPNYDLSAVWPAPSYSAATGLAL